MLKHLFKRSITFRKDHFKNVHIEHADLQSYLNESKTKFESAIESLEQKMIKEEQSTAIWFYLSLDHAEWLQPLIEDCNFKLHYTKDNKFVL